MDRVQRSGLIALAVLLLTAVGAHYVGSLPGSDATVPPRLAAQEPGTLEGVKFLPPEQRQFFVGPADFARPPVRNPMLGTQPRNIDASESVGNDPGSRTDVAITIPLTEEEPPLVNEPVKVTEPPLRASDLPPRQPGRFIRVRENDNLTRIAKRELNDGNRWREIATLNGIKAPYHVRLGQRIKLPDHGPASASASQTPQPSEEKEGRLYTVGKNETASHIALRFYGSADDFQKILDYNGIKDARNLAAGQVIRIPPR